MDSSDIQQRPLPHALPPITSLTNTLSPSDQASNRVRQQSDAHDARDSGNWSVSQSKRQSPFALTHMLPPLPAWQLHYQSIFHLMVLVPY
jgi:hypothetical protein